MKIRNLLTTLALTATFLIAGKVGWAQTLFEENFSYATGQLTSYGSGADVSGGNWVNYSGTANLLYVTTGSLTYPGYASSGIDNKVDLVAGSAEDAYRQFTTQTSGTVYAAFILNITTTTGLLANTSTTGDYTVSLTPSTNTSTLVGRVSVRTGSVANTFNIGIRTTSSNATASFIATDYPINTPILVVLSYQIVSGNTNDIANLWVNPAIGGTEPAADVTQTSALTTDPADIARITLRQGTNSLPGQIDGIRVATTWTDAVAKETTPPVATFDPTDAATGVAIDKNITITFDEAVRNIDDSAIDDTNVGSLITLKKDNSSGALVDFVATIDVDKKVITIDPTVDFDNSQVYYVAIASVEDSWDNATTGSNISFTTIPFDVTAPSWTATYPKINNLYNTSFDLLMNIDEPGVVYYVVQPDAVGIVPSVAQVKAGQDGSGAAAFKFGSKIIAAGSTEYSQTISGLTDGVTYDVYLVAEDNIPNTQASVTAIDNVTPPAIKAEPSNDVTGLATGTVTQNSIAISWTEDAVGPVLPDGYIIQVGTSAFGGDPTDGTPIPEDTDLSDGGAVYVDHGTTSYTLTGLSAATTYYIRVISYTNYNANINYKTGSIPNVSASTPMITLLTPNGGGTYYAGDNVNIQWSTAFIDAAETIVIEAAVDGATYSTIATSTNDGEQLITIPTDSPYATTYKVRVSWGTAASDESNAAFTVIPIISDVATLRSQAADNTSMYKFTGKATITNTDSYYNRKFIQDESGAILIYDSNTSPLITGTYSIGDGITSVIGKLNVVSGMLRFLPTQDASTTTGNPVIIPELKTVDVITTNDEAKLVKVANVSFQTTGNFATGQNYTVKDVSGNSLVFRTDYYNADYINTAIPSTSVTITGLLVDYNGTMQFTSRNLADFQSAVAKVTSSVYTVDDGTSDISNVPYTISVADFKANITPATNATFNVYDADGTTEATVINDTKLVKVTAEDGLTTKTYTITRVAANNDATLSTLTINGEDAVSLASIIVADPANAGATMWFDNFTNAKGIVATQNDANATIEIKLNDVIVADPVNQVLADNNVILITVTAEDGTTIKYYKVELQQKPIITATAGLNGTITPSGSVVVDYDINKAFDVTASGGYHISALTVDGSGISEAVGLTTYTYTFNNVVDDHTIDATFALTTYTVTFNVTDGTNPIEGATVSFNTTNANTDASGVAVFTDVAPATLAYSVVKTGYYDINSNVTVSNSDKTVNVTMILATVPTYTVTFNVKEGAVAVEGATVSLTDYGDQTTDASGVATFANVGAANGIAYTVNKTGYEQATGTVDVVDANVSEDVDLTKLTYTISASAGVNGTITPNNDVTVTYGTDQSFTVEASTGYHIALLLVDGNAVTAAANLATYTYPFTNVTANHTIAATFAINTYTITVTAGLNGTTSPNTNQTVNYGENLSFTVAADANYHIKDVLVDGASIGVTASYGFTNVTANHTFETQFEVDSHTITANVTPAGAGTVSGAGDYNYGATVTLTATANSGYKFKEWQVNSTSVETNATYTFTATEDLTVDAVFEEVVSDLFISEYLEGSSNNKAVELYNPTANAIDLSNYSMKKGTNGADFSTNLALSGTLEPGSTYVIANSGANAAILAVANYIDNAGTIVYFNGNDAIGLFKNGTLIDVIGLTDGVNPGNGWAVAGVAEATYDHTLVRKSNIVAGTTDWSTSAGTDVDNSQWIVNAKDDFSYLGWHINKSSEKDVLTFSLTEQTGAAIIDATAHTVSIEVVSGTDVTALVPTITVSKGATINPTSGTAQDFTNPKTYTVTAQDGTTLDWTVTVTVSSSLSSEKDIITFAIPSQVSSTVNATAATVDVVMPHGTDLSSLTPTITASAGATVNPASGVAQDFTAAVTYTVTAQDASTKDWTVTVTEEQVQTVSIYDIQHTTDASGNSPYNGMSVTTSGIVTAIKMSSTTGLQQAFYIQDAKGAWNGLYIYSATPVVAVGDNVTLNGAITEYNGLTEMTVSNGTINSSGNDLPGAEVISTADANTEAYESVLVKVTNANCASGSLGSFVVNDGTANLTVYKGLYTDLNLTIGTSYDITGVMTWFNTGSIYELYPRSASDVEVYTPKYTITFNVTHNSTALQGATITVNSQTLTTDANGSATIDLANGDYSYSVTMTGYTDHTGSFTVADAAKTVDVAMFLTGVETNTIAKLKVFPNPFNNEIRYEGTDITRVTITSIIGQVVMEKQLFGNESINTSNLVRGIYLVKFTNNKGETTLRKLIKE